MSDVTKDLRLVSSIDDVLPTYAGAGDDMRIGAEVELSFFDPAAPDLAPMTVPQNKIVKNAAAARVPGDWLRNEPTADTIEMISFAAPPGDLKAVFADIRRKLSALTAKAGKIGLKRSYFQHLPDRTAGDLFKNLMDLERYRAFFDPPRADMTDIAAYFAVAKSDQVSVSYRDPAHMLANVRRLNFLAPLLFMITDNTAGFDQGKKVTGHAGMLHRASLGARGGVPDYLFTAKTGEDYIRAHIDAVINNPLYVFYDENGVLQKIPSGEWSSFEKLKTRGLNTAANYWLAETVLWPDVKIAAIKDDAGNVVNHRYEARMFGVGIHQHQSALLIVAALAANRAFADQVDWLLTRYGFGTHDMAAAKALLIDSYSAARHHNGKFLDIPYGTGMMRDFAHEFAALLETAYIAQDYDDELAPILTILRSGCTDAKVNRILFPTLQDTLDHQRAYDPAIFTDPNACAKMLFERELKQRNVKTCSQNAV